MVDPEEKKLTPLRRHVLEYAFKYPMFAPTNTANRALVWLVNNGLIEGTNSNPTAAQGWKLTTAGRKALEPKS